MDERIGAHFGVASAAPRLIEEFAADIPMEDQTGKEPAEMKKFFTQNIGWKLLSLAAAVLLWISVASEPELATFVTAHVEYKDLARGVEINSDVPETVNLEVRGPTDALRLPDLPRNSAVVLDMSGIEPGQHTFTIDAGDVSLPRGVQLIAPSPPRFAWISSPPPPAACPWKCASPIICRAA